MAVFCFLAILIRYPSKPEHPPSLTANLERAPFIAGFKQLVKYVLVQDTLIQFVQHGSVLRYSRLPRFWMVALPYGIGAGTLACWGTVLVQNVHPLGVSEVLEQYSVIIKICSLRS